MKARIVFTSMFFITTFAAAHAKPLTVSNYNDDTMKDGQTLPQYQAELVSSATTYDLRGVDNKLSVTYTVSDSAIPLFTDEEKALAKSNVRLINETVKTDVDDINKTCAHKQKGNNLSTMQACLTKSVQDGGELALPPGVKITGLTIQSSSFTDK